MKMMRIAAVCAALCVMTVGAAGAVGTGPLMRGAEEIVNDVMPGDPAGTSDAVGSDTVMPDTTGATLGDTDADGKIESGTGDGFFGNESEMTDATDGTSRETGRESTQENATDTAQSSSGSESGGIGVFGVVLTIVILGAAAALIFALMPKKRA